MEEASVQDSHDQGEGRGSLTQISGWRAFLLTDPCYSPTNYTGDSSLCLGVPKLLLSKTDTSEESQAHLCRKMKFLLFCLYLKLWNSGNNPTLQGTGNEVTGGTTGKFALCVSPWTHLYPSSFTSSSWGKTAWQCFCSPVLCHQLHQNLLCIYSVSQPRGSEIQVLLVGFPFGFCVLKVMISDRQCKLEFSMKTKQSESEPQRFCRRLTQRVG